MSLPIFYQTRQLGSDGWRLSFEAHRRGRGRRVFVYPREDGVWFLVRRGEPFQRAESLNGPETVSVCYRPLKYDVLVYQPRIGELRVNARSKHEKRLYRTQFGKHFFGDEDFFPGDSKYTLEPLLTRGEGVLACVDVPGMEWVRLREVHFFLGGPSNEVEVHRRKMSSGRSARAAASHLTGRGSSARSSR